jgi:hypothetical protein
MSRQLRFGLWLAVMVFIVAVAIGFAMLAAGTEKPSRRLPDGSLLTLEAVTYGKEHRFVEGNWWQKLFYSFLPTQVQNSIPVHTYTGSSDRLLVFWTRRRPAARGQPLPHPFWQPRVMAFDQRGRTAETGGGVFRSVPDEWPVKECVEAWALPSFARRDHSVGLRLLVQDQRGHWVRAAEFVTRNPDQRPYPTWTAEPLPITQRDGDLAVTLTDLHVGPPPPRAAGDPNEMASDWTHYTIRYHWNGRPTSAWESAGFVLSDPTGGVCDRTHAMARTRVPGGERFSFRGMLWPGEPVWKLRVTLARTSQFRREELWTVANIPVPGLRKYFRLNQAASRLGARLSLRMIGGRAAGPCDWRNPCVELHMSPASGDLRVTLVRAIDERGGDVIRSGARFMYGNSGGAYGKGDLIFHLWDAAQAKRLTLTFAVQRPRVVEFVVKPVGV